MQSRNVARRSRRKAPKAVSRARTSHTLCTRLHIRALTLAFRGAKTNLCPSVNLEVQKSISLFLCVCSYRSQSCCRFSEEAGHYYGTFETQGFAQPGGWTQQAVSGVASLHETGYRQTLPPFGVEHSTDGPMPTAGSGGKLSGLQDSGSGKGGEAGLQRKQEEDATLKRTEEEMPSVDLGGSMPSGALGTTLQCMFQPFSNMFSASLHVTPVGWILS